MIRAHTLTGMAMAAALAVLPASAALAQDASQTDAEAAFEAQAEAFEARMEAVERQADAIQADESLSEEEQGARIAALMAEHQDEITAFSMAAASFAATAVAEAMADVDVASIVNEAMQSEDVQQAIAGGLGIAANSAWTHPDADQMVTYELMAQHELDQADLAAEDAADADDQ